MVHKFSLDWKISIIFFILFFALLVVCRKWSLKNIVNHRSTLIQICGILFSVLRNNDRIMIVQIIIHIFNTTDRFSRGRETNYRPYCNII